MAKRLSAAKDSETHKTSIKLPKALWRRASIRAMDDGRDLADVIADALLLYLTPKSKRGES